MYKNSHERGRCWVSDTYKLIFIPIAKNGTTSIRNIKEYEFKKSNLEALDEKLNDYKIFTVLREPIDRFVSGFSEECKRVSIDKEYLIDHDYYWENDLSKKLDLFSSNLVNGYFEGHVTPQIWFIKKYMDKINVFLNFDRLEKEINQFLPKSSDTIELPKYNINNSGYKDETKSHRSINSLIKNRKIIDQFRIALHLILRSASRKVIRKKVPRKKDTLIELQQNSAIKQKIEKFYEEDILLWNEKIRNK